MHLYTSADAASWCAERGIKAGAEGELTYGSAPKRRLTVAFPNGVPGLLYAARSLVRLETRGLYASTEQYEQEFMGCLLWVTRHDAWSHATEQVGAHLFTQLGVPAAPAGSELPTLDTYPARSFGSKEIVAAEASILQPLLFQWDAYVVPESGNFIATISHDGSIPSIIARRPEFLNSVKGVFGQMDVREAILPPEVIQRVGA